MGTLGCALQIVSLALVPEVQGRHPVPREHPYLLGTRQELQALARQRPEAYRRVVRVAVEGQADAHSQILSMGLVAAIERDAALARQVKERALKFVDGPIRQGHVPFGSDLALCALAYDLAHDAWSVEERQRLHEYLGRTVTANVQSETHVFHNGWYGYKHWGIGLAGYATYHENVQAPAILKALEEDYRTRAAPALELAGAGGGWAEGYYIHYWLYEWLFFCEVARRCEGVDYYALAPSFYTHRAVASMFEMYPGLGEYHTRRPLPMGDGGGRLFGGDRDKALAARRILVNYFRDDPAHQAVHAFNESTPRSGVGVYAYKDLLWRDPSVPLGNLKSFRLSHLSPGPGYVYARSSWDEAATHFFFKCGDRFTAHQHLDVGHFLIYKHAELAGDGGHYDAFGSRHDVNYHLRTIAHNTVLIHDPAERWPSIRAGNVSGNDGGQHHNWPHHNGAVADPADWQRGRSRYDIADLLAFEDQGNFVYVAGDASRAYATNKLEAFTRQVVYLRPDTFVIFDRVQSTQPHFQKTWLLQAMQPPTHQAPHLVITHGRGRLFVQTLLPEQPQVTFHSGNDLYRYGGHWFPPQQAKGAAPECRIEISPSKPARTDYFLHVLTAADSDTATVPHAAVSLSEEQVEVTLSETKLTFARHHVGGSLQDQSRRVPFAPAARTE